MYKCNENLAKALQECARKTVLLSVGKSFIIWGDDTKFSEEIKQWVVKNKEKDMI